MSDRLYSKDVEANFWNDAGRLVIDGVPWGALLVSEDGRIVDANTAATKILGVRAEEMSRWPIADSSWRTIRDDGTDCPPNEHPVAVAAQARRAVRRVIGVYNRTDAAYRWLDLAAVPDSRFRSGASRLIIATFADITELFAQIAGLKASETRYRRRAGRQAPRGSTLDGDLRFVEVDETWLSQLGYARKEVVGRPVSDFLFAGQADAFLAQVPLFKAIGRIQASFPMRARSGAPIAVAFGAELLADRQSRPRQPKSSVHELDTVRRTEEQLRIAERMEVVGRLAAGIAHDFNNVIGTIAGYADLLDEKLASADSCKADVREIALASQRAAALTAQLLAFSRQQAIQPTVLNVHQLLSGTGEWLKRLIGEHIEMVVRPGQGPGTALADASQIEQVIMNLVLNARDAMPDGGTLTLESAEVEFTKALTDHATTVPPGAYVTIAVSDTGHGIDDAARARIFDPFFTTKTNGEGTGLGLATVQTITQQARGHITVTSEVGRGTTFKVYLPRVSSAAAPRPVPQRPASTPIRARAGETILVVEDDKGVRELSQRILENAGYTVLIATDGIEAQLVMDRHTGPVHLVLTDVVMPRSSGRDLVSRLMKVVPDLRVIYMSGYLEESVLHRGITDSGAEFIAKPFGVSSLTRKVREVLDA